MRPLYIIVHPQSAHQQGPAGSQQEVREELERIVDEEEHMLWFEETGREPALPDRPLRVCGAYKELCVWQVWRNLRDRGYDASIYSPASYTAFPDIRCVGADSALDRFSDEQPRT